VITENLEQVISVSVYITIWILSFIICIRSFVNLDFPNQYICIFSSKIIRYFCWYNHAL